MSDSPELDPETAERVEFLETLIDIQQQQKQALEQDVARLTMLVRSQRRVIDATTSPDPS